MIDYGLRPDEAFVCECENVMSRKSQLNMLDEKGMLVLTDKNILWITKGLFNRIKEIKRYSLSNVKVYRNKAQVFLKMEKNSAPNITVFFCDGQISLDMSDKDKAIDMANHINKLVMKNDEDIFAKRTLPGAEFIAETLKGTAIKVRDIFDFGNNEPRRESAVRNCTRCGAYVSGIKGTTVKCENCGQDVDIN